ncbi:MAG: hypothetical protein JEZ06_11480 [Anaerolineaceae bacterium]|nr:hypothetical protein [Anaerolineaceae bacterium]
MNLEIIISELNLELLTVEKDFSQVIPSKGYASDLLSCVIAGAQNDGIWITVQSHINIVAVAALLNLSAIIISENSQLDAETIKKANEEGITILISTEETYSISGKLWSMGLH